MLRASLLVASALLGVLTCGPAAAAFVNPLIEDNAADPHIVRHDGWWYLTATTPPGEGSPWRLVVRRARTLAGLRGSERHVVWDPTAAGEPASRRAALWAPELHRLRRPDGTLRWFLYYTAGPGNPLAQRDHVLESAGDDPLGPYVFRGTLHPSAYAIDGTVWQRPTDGRLFYFWAGSDLSHASSSVFVSELRDPWTVAGPAVLVTHPQHAWERVGLPIDEAPEVLTRDGRLHVVFSASYCGTDGYALGRVTVGHDADLLDPATWRGAKHPSPIFSGSPERGVWSPGHAGFFASPDGRESWMVYGAAAGPGGTVAGHGCGGVRSVRAQPFAWRPDGTPDLGVPVRLGDALAEPSAACPARAVRVRVPARWRRAFRRAVVTVDGRRVAAFRPPTRSARVVVTGRARIVLRLRLRGDRDRRVVRTVSTCG